MKKRLFGTDGIRGRVGSYPITAEFMLKLGWAAGRVLSGQGRNTVLIGKDTRISGYMFESALEAGLSAAGVNIHLLGPMPTPGIAYLTRTLHAEAGIVISASHNPHYDNGLKFFSGDGQKLPDEIEFRIEEELDKAIETVPSEKLGKAERVRDAAGRYIEFCKGTIPSRMELEGMALVVDCAHGATYHIAPNVFEELGAKVRAFGTEPNGLNINAAVGSTHPAALQKAVVKHGADLGIALDGDGDRVIMVDAQGEVVDGDELLYIIARSRKIQNGLDKPIVGTQMSNLGLEMGLRQLNLDFKRAAVGDRYVMELLRKHKCYLGGESSGHLICLDRTTTGDGIIAALQVLAAMVQEGKTLHQLKAGMSKYPQCLVNVHIERKVNLEQEAGIKTATQKMEAHLQGRGRVLLRTSGTEPLIRVMVEGQDQCEVEQLVQELAEKVRSELG